MRSKRIGLGLLIICLSLPSCILGQDVGPSASENPITSSLPQNQSLEEITTTTELTNVTEITTTEESVTVTEVPITTTVVSAFNSSTEKTNITESELSTTTTTVDNTNINTTVAQLSTSTTTSLLSSTTPVSTEVTSTTTAVAENVTEKIESIFDENNNNTINTTQITIGDGITQQDGDAIVLQKIAMEEVDQDDLDTLRTQMIVVTSVIGGIVILILILVLALAVSISRMKSQFIKRQQYIPSTVENTGALSSPGRHSRQEIHAYDNSAFTNGNNSHEMEERRADSKAEVERMGYEMYNGNKHENSYADPIELKKENEGRITPPYGTEAQSSERRNSSLSYSSTRSRDRNGRRQIRKTPSGLLCCTAAKAVKRNYY